MASAMAISNSSLQLFRLTNITLFIGYWVFMILTYPSLPVQVPMHFEAGGEATRFSDTTIFSWFLVPGAEKIPQLNLTF